MKLKLSSTKGAYLAGVRILVVGHAGLSYSGAAVNCRLAGVGGGICAELSCGRSIGEDSLQLMQQNEDVCCWRLLV